VTYALEEIGTLLKEARERKGLSQRALSTAADLPQAQISKIENGHVDLKLSTLLKLARTLDLEPVLIPRSALPAVRSLIRGTTPGTALSTSTDWSRRLMQALEKTAARPERTDYAQLVRVLRELDRLAPVLDSHLLEHFDPKRWKAWLSKQDDQTETRQLLDEMRSLRNRAAHEHTLDGDEEIRPAYSLDEDDDA